MQGREKRTAEAGIHRTYDLDASERHVWKTLWALEMPSCFGAEQRDPGMHRTPLAVTRPRRVVVAAAITAHLFVEHRLWQRQIQNC